MTLRAMTHVFDTYDEAARAVDALEAAGIPHADISLVGNRAHASLSPGGEEVATEQLDMSDAAAGAGVGATLGAIVGGGAGLLAGIGIMAMPGIGPVVAAGWLIATVTGAGAGAAAGGLLGALTGAGVSETDAHRHNDGVLAGGTLVSVRADEDMVDRVEEILGSAARAKILSDLQEDGAGWGATEGLPGARAEDVRMRSPLV